MTRVLPAQVAERPLLRATPRADRTPAWLSLTAAAIVLVELAFVGYARSASALAHVHALQALTTVSDASPGLADAACAEAAAATGDAWPLVPLLGFGRWLPVASARAWGQVPILVDALRTACPALSTAGRFIPWRDDSIANGALRGVLTQVRSEPDALTSASADLSAAWQMLTTVDSTALAGDARLDRAARALDTARQSSGDLEAMLRLMQPSRLEALLGGTGPRAWVIQVAGADDQAFAILENGDITAIGTGQPTIGAASTIFLDQNGLQAVAESVGRIDAIDPRQSIAQAVLLRMLQISMSDVSRVATVLRNNAEQHHAWFEFDDPLLQSVAERHGWTRQ